MFKKRIFLKATRIAKADSESKLHKLKFRVYQLTGVN